MPYDPHDKLEVGLWIRWGWLETLTRIIPTMQNYVIERLLGRGGSSKVYGARCTRGRLRGRRVALKIVRL